MIEDIDAPDEALGVGAPQTFTDVLNIPNLHPDLVPHLQRLQEERGEITAIPEAPAASDGAIHVINLVPEQFSGELPKSFLDVLVYQDDDHTVLDIEASQAKLDEIKDIEVLWVQPGAGPDGGNRPLGRDKMGALLKDEVEKMMSLSGEKVRIVGEELHDEELAEYGTDKERFGIVLDKYLDFMKLYAASSAVPPHELILSLEDIMSVEAELTMASDEGEDFWANMHAKAIELSFKLANNKWARLAGGLALIGAAGAAGVFSGDAIGDMVEHTAVVGGVLAEGLAWGARVTAGVAGDMGMDKINGITATPEISESGKTLIGRHAERVKGASFEMLKLYGESGGRATSDVLDKMLAVSSQTLQLEYGLIKHSSIEALGVSGEVGDKGNDIIEPVLEHAAKNVVHLAAAVAHT